MKETHDLEVGYEVKKDLGLDKDIGPDTCNEYPIQLELESGLNENRKDGEKRGEHPVTSNSSGGDRLNKKRRENENDFEEINKVKVFVNGTDNVRGDEERMVSQVNLKEANDFNDFINEAKLVEIPIRGRKFTRVSDDEMKLYAQVQVRIGSGKTPALVLPILLANTEVRTEVETKFEAKRKKDVEAARQ
ncbi:hypothetical protein Tco_0389696 [Tanacetum coccineum]